MLHPNNIVTFFDHMDSKFVKHVAKFRPWLRNIDLNQSGASEKDVVTLLKSCKQLHPKDIKGGCKGDLYCEAVTSLYPDLEEIEITGANTTEIGLITLLKGCPGMHPNGITATESTSTKYRPVPKGDLFLEAVVKLRPDITEISLEPGCGSLSDKGLAALVSDFDIQP